MPKCWAAALGGCSSRQSSEHSISRNLLEGDVVYVRGWPWCREEEREVSPNTLTQNILCTAHNSLLSPTDSAGGDLFRAFGAMKREAARRLRTRKPHKLLRVYRVNGVLAERWFLKTVVNTGIGMTRGSWQPTEAWVRRAFGLLPFDAEEGLYLLPGERNSDVRTYKFGVELLADGTQPIGGLIELDGLSFAVCAERFAAGDDWLLRPKALADRTGATTYQKIIFDWTSR
jgi:hypothetical protein